MDDLPRAWSLKIDKVRRAKYQGYFRMICQHCTKGCLFPGISIPITLCARCGSCSVHTSSLHDGDTASMGRPDHRIFLMPPIKTLREHNNKVGEGDLYITDTPVGMLQKERLLCRGQWKTAPRYTSHSLNNMETEVNDRK